ncbi:MAG: CsbD family protein [Terracidiphilus sp.]|nr:CsbD family protein [Terracidiphilus sp.]
MTHRESSSALGVRCVPFDTAPFQRFVSNWQYEVETMNKDRVKGAIDEAVGSAKRHVGSLTGNTGTQIEGAVQQLKGKTETTVGKMKEAVRDAVHKAAAPPKTKEAAKHEHCEVVVVEEHRIL